MTVRDDIDHPLATNGYDGRDDMTWPHADQPARVTLPKSWTPGRRKVRSAPVLATIPRAAAPAAPSRLLLVSRRAKRAVLDGAWWPRSLDAPAELSGLVLALSERFGPIRYVILNGTAWTGRTRRLMVDDHVLRVGWFASMPGALLVATTDGGDQLDLLIVPPAFANEAAEGAMARAADPANVLRAPAVLAHFETPKA